MQRSYDCPECGRVAFAVVKRPNILRCLYCGCEWEFSMPLPEVEKPPDDEAVRKVDR
jgi:transcription elongation factor Elf1